MISSINKEADYYLLASLTFGYRVIFYIIYKYEKLQFVFILGWEDR